MDKRLAIINELKKQLNGYLVTKTSEHALREKQTPIINYSQLRAQMLCVNVQSGMALDSITFNNSNVYAEFVHNGVLNFHIYPNITEGKESLTKHVEIEEEKRNIILVKAS